MEEIETYIGNIESGKSGSIDILTNAVATTAASGDMSKVIVTYEDKEGNETTIEGNFKATVESPVYDNVEKIKDSTKSSDKKVLYGVNCCGYSDSSVLYMCDKKAQEKKGDS